MKARIIFLSLLLLSPVGHAFWYPLGTPGHRSITSNAMKQVKYVHEGAELTFHDDVYDKIIAANVITDDEDEYRYDPADHFDNEMFEKGARRIMNKRRVAMDALKRGDPESAWIRVGSVLHAIQDFYAHSSWLDVERPGVASHYDIELPSDAARLQSFINEVGDPLGLSTCGADSKELIEKDVITSGYYVKPFAQSMLPYRPGGGPDSATKCVHLGATNWVEVCQAAPLGPCIYVPMVGFEKDAPGTDIAERARERATVATKAFLDGIIKELDRIGTPDALRGICDLLGRDPNLCAPSRELTQVYKFTELCVQSVPGTWTETRTNDSGTTTRQIQNPIHVCISPVHPIGQPVYFCREGTRWIPKRDYVEQRAGGGTTAPRGRVWHDWSITPDGTISARYARRDRLKSVGTQATFITVHDFDYSATVNESTGQNYARFTKTEEDERIGFPGFPSHRFREYWYASGSTSLPITFLDRFYFKRELVAVFAPGEKLPDHCFKRYTPAD